VRHIESAQEMLAACRQALPADIAVCAAAVADWRPAKVAAQKMKKTDQEPAPLKLVRNPDILASLSASGNERPRIVVGFAAETENLVANARKKLAAKGCDLIVANDVSPETGTFGGDNNTVHLVSREGVESWPRLSKQEVAERLTDAIVQRLAAEA
jgi:phosphopantothenoylcysteine decarboxylase/phosphopantothenate--cysteine ligase